MKNITTLLLVFISSCPSTKVIKYSALPKLVEGEKILLSGIDDLSDIRGYELYKSAGQIMSKTNEVKFLPELEYDLLQQRYQ